MTARHRVLIIGGGFGGLYTAKTLKDVKAASVYIKVQFGLPVPGSKTVGGTGSGFLIRAEGDTGFFVTNHHVLTPPKEIPGLVRVGPVVLVFNSGHPKEKLVNAEVVASDPCRQGPPANAFDGHRALRARSCLQNVSGDPGATHARDDDGSGAPTVPHAGNAGVVTRDDGLPYLVARGGDVVEHRSGVAGPKGRQVVEVDRGGWAPLLSHPGRLRRRAARGYPREPGRPGRTLIRCTAVTAGASDRAGARDRRDRRGTR